MKDITYCVNAQCPFKDCERHISKAGSGLVSVASLDGVCRRYLVQILKEERDVDE